MYWLMRACAACLALLPRGWALALGAALGQIWFSVVRIRRRTVLANLAASLPELTAAERRRIARECYRNQGRSAIEFLLVARLPPARLAGLVRLEGVEHLDAARALGRGVIVVTGHFGNWDLLSTSQAAAGLPLHVVTKRLRQGGLERFWRETREAQGVRLLADRGSLGDLLQALREEALVALIVDQHDPSPSAVVVDFLGRPAACTTAPALLARRTGAPLLPVFVERQSDGTHRARLGPRIECQRTDDQRRDVRETTERIQQTLEAAIRARPDHWLWLHRRWKVEEGQA